MFIFILLLVAGAAGGGFYWYKTKVDECQKEYDKRFSEIRSNFNYELNYTEYYESSCECISNTGSIIPDIIKMRKYPAFVVNKVKPNFTEINAMYKELLLKLYSDFDNAFANGADYTTTLDLIKKMQYAITFVRDKNGCKSTIEDNKLKTRKYYTDVQQRLFSEFNNLLQSNANIPDVWNKLKNMLDSPNLVYSLYDFGFNEVIDKNLELVKTGFQSVQLKLEDDFNRIGQDFLEKANYESIICLIDKIIADSRMFIETFSNYAIKPADNSKTVAYMSNVLEGFKKLYKNIENSDDCYMISDYEYGKYEKDFYDDVTSATIENIEQSVDSYYAAFELNDFEKIINVDLKTLAKQLWFFATLKPFLQNQFEKSSKLYSGFFKNTYTAEILLAEIYYIKQMGGDGVIKSKINELLDEKNGKLREMIKYNVVIDKVGEDKNELTSALIKVTNMSSDYADKIVSGHTKIVQEGISYNKASSMIYELNRTGSLASIKYHQNTSSKLLTTIASGLMWIGAYDCEKQILEYMLSKQLPLSQKQQERLHSLNNGGGNAPKGFKVSSSQDMLYFDISSISWHDEEYKGFFENLAFEEKILSYSVAVRDEDKELMISRRVKLPALEIVLEKIKKIFTEEYGDTVGISICSCCALSGNTEEKLMGILVQSSECPHLGVLVHMACIGKKFTIKFFTLFMPESQKIEEQRQQLISLHKKMSPSVTMWENSLKDTILIAFQQLLNELPAADTIVNDSEEVEF